MNYYAIKDKESFMRFRKEHPDFIIPLIYDSVGRNILKNHKQVLLLMINNILQTNFKEDEIILKDGRMKKERYREKQRECDVFVEVGEKVINIEINKKKTNSMDRKNMSYIGDMLKNYYEAELCQINLNDFDIFKRGKEIYLSKMKEEESGLDRFEDLKIYDVSIGVFKEKCYTDSRRYDEDFVTLMQIFESNSRREIEQKIGTSILLREVYEMQKKLNNEDFILERFPDDVFHEMEKKELKKEGIEQGKIEIIKTLLKKNMTPEEIANLLDYEIEKVRQVEKSCK